ncbi:MAG: phosphopyruvate hydratase [Alphaproteobacteria bacterium]|nr:phosphopyruvate hydratase [Alphaproteobacteria bacterium]
MAKIVSVKGRRVWDSRARPTVETEIALADGATGRAIAPAGASMGSGEAVDLRDGGTSQGGMDVTRAVANVAGPLAEALIGLDATDQAAVDRAIRACDNSQRFERLGGNAAIATSMAVLHAAAASARAPLDEYLAAGGPVSIPVPEIQIFGGGAHAGRRVDIQDFLIVCPSARNFAEALDRTADVYHAARKLLKDEGRLQGVADEGGFWPVFATNDEALEMLVRAIEAAGYTPGDEVHIALDIAASDFGRNGRYKLGLENRELDSDAMCDMLLGWLDRYPILSIEDPLAEDDHAGFMRFMAAAGDRVQVVGDDLLVTDPARVATAARDKLVNCALIKPNQIGTVTETKAALDAAKAGGISAIVSARSGETEDISIAPFAVGWNAGQFKVGSIARGERTAKWNEMLRIEERLGSRAPYAGWGAFPVKERSAR